MNGSNDKIEEMIHSANQGIADGASVRIQRRIQWADTEPAGQFKATATMRLVEEAEMALYRELGLPATLFPRLPRVDLGVDFHAPLRFDDLVDIVLTVSSVGDTSITYRFEIKKLDILAVSGYFVAVLLDERGERRTSWPVDLRTLLLDRSRR